MKHLDDNAFPKETRARFFIRSVLRSHLEPMTAQGSRLPRSTRAAFEDTLRITPTLLLTGENDNRVNPMHSRKMITRLQAANTSGAPLLLRTSGNTGHGLGTPTSAQIEELTDVYSFIMKSLGISCRTP